MKVFRWLCRVYGGVLVRWSTGKSFSKYFDDQLEQEELLGFQGSQAPMAKLLVAIIKQCRSDGFRFIFLDPNDEEDCFKVQFSKEFDHFGQVPLEPMDAMTVPKTLWSPLACHASWRINHQDSIFDSVNRNLVGVRNHFEPNAKDVEHLSCRCWLRNPDDCRSLVIQLLEPAGGTPAHQS